MWIKICANTNLEDAQLAVDAGADAVGFVFAESPRQVTRAQVRTITPHLPKAVEKYGVFVDSSFDEVVETIVDCGLTGVQLHATTDPRLASRLRDHFGAATLRSGILEVRQPGKLSILRVTHYASDFGSQLDGLRKDQAVDAVLIDSRTAKAVGGTGIAFDWQAAQTSFLRNAPHLRLIAAGGLRTENVAEAIYTLQPWGVDVASGVESAPGKKDPNKVKAFVNAVRQATAQINESKSWLSEATGHAD
jgi:phosphoribosylanthranilate isomerase